MRGGEGGGDQGSVFGHDLASKLGQTMTMPEVEVLGFPVGDRLRLLVEGAVAVVVAELGLHRAVGRADAFELSGGGGQAQIHQPRLSGRRWPPG